MKLLADKQCVRPAAGKLETSPPFARETTIGIIATALLDEHEFQVIEGRFAKGK